MCIESTNDAIDNTIKAVISAGQDFTKLDFIRLTMDRLAETPFGKEAVYKTIYPQALLKGQRCITSLTMYLYHDGTAICHGIIWEKPNKKTGCTPPTVAFWKFNVCYHDKDVEKTNLGNCYNQYHCNTCGYTWSVDSSD